MPDAAQLEARLHEPLALAVLVLLEYNAGGRRHEFHEAVGELHASLCRCGIDVDVAIEQHRQGLKSPEELAVVTALAPFLEEEVPLPAD